MTELGLAVTLAGLEISDPPGRWAALGFAVGEGGGFLAGGIAVRLGIAPAGHGIAGWTLRGLAAEGPIAGLRTAVYPESSPPGWTAAARVVAPLHPNGACAIDHIVVTTPDLDAIAAELDTRGLTLRRRAEVRGARMGFRRLGGPILEVVEAPDVSATAFWGVTFAVRERADLDALAAGNRLVGEPHPAVQPGRRIATVSREAGLSTRVAFIDPEQVLVDRG